jgi:hypothetical protein
VALLKVSPIDLTSLFGFTPRPDLPAGKKAARLAQRPLSCAPVPRPGITLERSVKGGRRPLASGTPARRGARNSETLRQQPDQPLVRESIPTRVTVADSVGAFPGASSRRIGDQSHADLIQVNKRSFMAGQRPSFRCSAGSTSERLCPTHDGHPTLSNTSVRCPTPSGQ